MWVEEKLIPQLGKYHLGEPRSIVVMDNATNHSGVKELIEAPEVRAKLIFLSPYSPELNPIK
jgi:transposase